MASTSQQSEERDLVDDSKKIKVTILASEWGSRNGGIGTLSKEVAVQLAKFPDVEVTTFLVRCSEEDKKSCVCWGARWNARQNCREFQRM